MGTALREGKTARAKFDREDDDFAEFDFDPEAEEGEGECPNSAHHRGTLESLATALSSSTATRSKNSPNHRLAIGCDIVCI